MSSNTSTGTSRVTRACDGCRIRKVRCNGAQPCSQCAHLNLTCVFAPAPAKRKPGVRGRLVAQLRGRTNGSTNNTVRPSAGGGGGGGNGGADTGGADTGGADSTTSSTSSPAGLTSPASAAAAVSAPPVTSIAGIVHSDHTHQQSNTRLDLVPGPDAAGYTADFFLDLLPLFAQHVYPVNPIIPADELRISIEHMHDNFEDAALVYAFAAVTINLTQTSWMSHGDIASQLTYLMQTSLNAHRRAELGGGCTGAVLGELPVTIKRIMTCIFLEISLLAFKRFDRCFAILREAIAMIQVLNVHQYSRNETSLQPAEVAKRQRLYWETFIHERFLSTVTGYPCILPPLKTGNPFADPTIPPHIDAGFNCIIHLFLTMDEQFLSYWSVQEDPRHQVPEMTAQWIESKQAQLDQDEAGAIEAEGGLSASGRGVLTEIQHADLFVTRLWLRTLVWQLALSHGLLQSAPAQNTHEGLSLHFPAHRLSAQLRSLVCRLDSVASIAIHGSGILQKLFEITSTVADVLALPLGQGQTQEDARTRMEDYVFLVKFLFSFERIQKEQRDYLREKLEVLQEVYTIVDFGGLAGASPDM